MKPQVLIVGAGPTGLVLALRLARHRVPFRIIEKHSGPGEASRALVVHARTLEFYQQMGFAEEIVNRGIKINAIHYRKGIDEKAEINFLDLGKGLSPFPFALSYPQDDHEKLLTEKLAAAGVEIEWNTELISYKDDGERIQAVIKKNGKEETSEFAYLCGCDGAHSTVRKGLDLKFPGGTYEQLFFVADVEADIGNASQNTLNVYLDSEVFYLYMPVRSSGMERIVGIIPAELSGRESIQFTDFQTLIEKRTGIKVKHVNWFSTYKVHHRVSEHFSRGRVFIAGDAGHIHSPAGGQGMNTGIGDAVNLSWKLAAVLLGKADESILPSYEEERLAFAKTLISSTDKAFTNIIGNDPTSRLLRTVVIPHIAPFLLNHSSAARKAAFNAVSQTRINYRDSEISEGTSNKIHGGDRLPWTKTKHGDNFEPLQSMDWQIHVYGEAKESLKECAADSNISLHEFPWAEGMGDTGLKRNSLYLIRPDGYIALTEAGQDVGKLRQYLSKFKISSIK
ncbi:FAD-dependent monooxygenase [Metabacillus sp. RGM 3146]|uniref:FAD-dependent monooxygenase n=1 Tax=Metabacillus sp. RGM 3146 TaxID=3401092 RepID=UPI003B9C8D94